MIFFPFSSRDAPQRPPLQKKKKRRRRRRRRRATEKQKKLTCCEVRSVDGDELGQVGEVAVEPGDLELGGAFFFFLKAGWSMRLSKSKNEKKRRSTRMPLCFRFQSLSPFSHPFSYLLPHSQARGPEAVKAQKAQPSRPDDGRGGSRGRHHRRARKHQSKS